MRVASHVACRMRRREKTPEALYMLATRDMSAKKYDEKKNTSERALNFRKGMNVLSFDFDPALMKTRI